MSIYWFYYSSLYILNYLLPRLQSLNNLMFVSDTSINHIKLSHIWNKLQSYYNDFSTSKISIPGENIIDVSSLKRRRSIWLHSNSRINRFKSSRMLVNTTMGIDSDLSPNISWRNNSDWLVGNTTTSDDGDHEVL